jgi:hypothetical protein
VLKAFWRFPQAHWRGELPLWASWWASCVAVTWGLWALGPWLTRTLGIAAGDTPTAFTGMVLWYLIQVGLVPLWQLVGLSRASDNAFREGGSAVLGRAGQVATVLLAMLFAMQGLMVASQTAIGARLAYAFGPYAYQVTLLPGGREIEVRGGLGMGVSRDFAALLKANPGVRRVRLNSGGGSLSEAQRLRQVIVENRLDTITTSRCSSACFSVFLGGRFRYLQKGAVLAVHLPRNWTPLGRGPLAPEFSAELKYLSRSGVPDWFLASWIRTGQNFWTPTEFQLRRAGVITAVRGVAPKPG